MRTTETGLESPIFGESVRGRSTRGRELSGFKDWIEKFCGWLCLIQDAYGAELAEAINANYQIQHTRSPEQTMLRTRNLVAEFQQFFAAKAHFDPSSNPWGPSMGSRGVPLKQMPVNLGPPPEAKRLFHLLQQNFVGYSKIENLIRSQISSTGITESNGFELLRLIRMEFSLMSRTEALSYREQCLKFLV